MISALSPSESAPKQSKSVYLSPRLPGDPLWAEITQSYNNKQKRVQQAKMDKEMEIKKTSEDP